MNMAQILFRRPNQADAEHLYDMVVASTNGHSRVSKDQLCEDLFGVRSRRDTFAVRSDEDFMLDVNCIGSNCPMCLSFVAQHGGELIGYVLYHYYYSPWLGHSSFIDDVYIKEAYRKQGIAKKLLLEVIQSGRSRNIQKVLFNSKRVDLGLMKKIQKHNIISYRDDSTDWSVIQIKFK